MGAGLGGEYVSERGTRGRSSLRDLDGSVRLAGAAQCLGARSAPSPGLYAHCGARKLPVYKHSYHFCDSLLAKWQRDTKLTPNFRNYPDL
jgi:hypothetical protein